MTTPYDSAFYAEHVNGSLAAARAVSSIVCMQGLPSSVIDLGCGVGTWLKAFEEQGSTRLVGVDGPWVDREAFLCATGTLYAKDLREPVEGLGIFDLAMSLETAEHLPETSADIFVDSLVGLAPVILFSAAFKGQTGADHINEQPEEYWIAKFNSRGYEMRDNIRPIIKDMSDIPWWYRHNIIMFYRR